MMNANVRRLVFDLSPRGYVWGQGFGWLLLAIVAAAGTSIPEHYSSGALLGLFASIWGWTCTSKFDLWQNLPVAVKELKLSQFWVLLGMPTIIILSSNILGLLITLVLYDHIAVKLVFFSTISCQLYSVISIAFLLYALCISSVFQRRLFVSLSLINFSIIFVLCLMLTFRTNSSQLILNSTIALGIISLLACLAALVWNQHLPLISLEKSYPRQTTPSSATSSSTRSRAQRPAGGHTGVWRLLAGSIRRIAPFAGFAYGLLVLVFPAPNSMGIAGLEMPMAALQLAPLVCLVLMPLGFWEPQRVLVGLPVSALSRTAALQLVVPALLVPAWILMMALGALFRSDAMTPHWWIACGFTFLTALSLGAASFPVSLRLGRLGMLLLYGGLCGITGAMIGLSPIRFGERWALEGRPSTGDMKTIGALVLIVILGWIWTYMELAYGRKAYQSQGLDLFPVRWRGGGAWGIPFG